MASATTIDRPTEVQIGYQRTCECPPNHINCLDAKEWTKNQIGVWQFAYNGKDIRDKKVHPATFPVALASRAISLFTHKGELVVDPFVGAGSTLVAAQDLGRNAIGADLSEDYVNVSRTRLGLPDPEGAQQIAIVEDARTLSSRLVPESVRLILTSPPYANMLNRKRKNKSRRSADRRNGQYGEIEQYSQDERDLGILTAHDYSDAIEGIFRSLRPALAIGGHVVINVNDLWHENARIPLHSMVIQAMTDAGYSFRNIIIWDRTNIVNRIGIIGWPSNYITMGTTFEYILHFQRFPDND